MENGPGDWWQWFSGIRSNQNPGIDNSGAFCNVGQPNKDVWFLTLTFGTANQVSRGSTFPAGRSDLYLFFLMIVIRLNIQLTQQGTNSPAARVSRQIRYQLFCP